MEDKKMYYLLCFLAGILLCYLALSYEEGHSTKALKKMIDNLETKFIVLEKKFQSNNEKQDSIKLQMEGIQKINSNLLATCRDLDEDVKGATEYCEKLRLSQIDLQDKLSNKRPVMKVTSPIPVQVVEEKKTGNGVQSLIKKAGIKN